MTEIEKLAEALDACFGVMMQISLNSVNSRSGQKWTVSVGENVFLEARKRAEKMYYEAKAASSNTVAPVDNIREQLISFLMDIDECYAMHIRENAERCVDNYLAKEQPNPVDSKVEREEKKQIKFSVTARKIRKILAAFYKDVLSDRFVYNGAIAEAGVEKWMQENEILESFEERPKLIKGKESTDAINKIECILGYCKAWVNSTYYSPYELPRVIEECEEWLKEQTKEVSTEKEKAGKWWANLSVSEANEIYSKYLGKDPHLLAEPSDNEKVFLFNQSNNPLK